MKHFLFLTFIFVFISSCEIGDDFIDDYMPLEIRVINANSIPKELTIRQTYQFEADFYNDVGNKVENSITWESSNLEVITIDNSGKGTAVGEGSTTISATAQNDNPDADTPPITIKIADILVNTSNNRLTINNPISTLNIDDIHQYVADFSGTTTVTWESSNLSIASINSSSGLVTALKKGKVTITASTIEDEVTLTNTTDLEVVSQASKSGTLSGSYNLSGTVVLTSTSLMFTDFVSTAPDTHIHLTNNPTSIAGGLQVSVNKVTTNDSFSLELLDNINVNDYSFVVAVCKGAGNFILGSAALN